MALSKQQRLVPGTRIVSSSQHVAPVPRDPTGPVSIDTCIYMHNTHAAIHAYM